MVNANSFLSELYIRFNLPVAGLRRESLVSEMRQLKKGSIHCLNCQGDCCTSSNNSMMVDPLQALELLTFLMSEKRLDADLIKDLSLNIQKHRLHIEIPTGKKTHLRKTYTCPFFKKGARGCSISPEYKPYGCLAFNPLHADVHMGGDCASNINLLQQREDFFEKSENEAIQFLKNILDLYWDKKPIPQALSELIEKLPKMAALIV